MIALLSIPVLLYQMLFVVILLVASNLGRVWLNLAVGACLLWTATHVFLPPLAVLQATVILITYFALRSRAARRSARSEQSPPH